MGIKMTKRSYCPRCGSEYKVSGEASSNIAQYLCYCQYDSHLHKFVKPRLTQEEVFKLLTQGSKKETLWI